jgi:hypothetical protein
METHSLSILQCLAGAFVGGAIGYVFGVLQEIAAKRYEQRMREGGLKTAWAVMPGSARRVAALLVVLALVQIACPMLFTEGVQWWVSGGVALGYGLSLFLRLRQRLKSGAA